MGSSNRRLNPWKPKAKFNGGGKTTLLDAIHLHRGISYLATPGAVRSVADLVKLSVEG